MIQRLLADADLNVAIVLGVIRHAPEIDFKRAEEVPLEGLPDEDVLAAAQRESRVLVSHDVSTMPTNLRRFVLANRSPGVIIIPQGVTIGAAIENLLLICHAFDPAELENRVCLVPSMVVYGF